MSTTNYPTEWFGGHYRGSIADKKTSWMVRLNDDTGKQISKSFSFKPNTKEQSYNDANKWMQEKSDEYRVTVNKIRYLDPDTIEVQLPHDQKFITNTKFLDEVKKFKIHTKIKKEKNDITYRQSQ